MDEPRYSRVYYRENNFTAADINELCHLFTLVTVLISCINSKDNAGLLKIIYKLQERL